MMHATTEDKLGSVHSHVESMSNSSSMMSPRSDEDNLSIRDDARGDNLPEGYFMSLQFIGTFFVSTIQTRPRSRVPG
jgi:hypothetical protein